MLFLFCALLTPTAGALAPSEVVGALNRVRSSGCKGAQRPALTNSPALQSAATRMANGASAQSALNAIEYQASAMSSIHLSGYNEVSELRVLLQKKY